MNTSCFSKVCRHTLDMHRKRRRNMACIWFYSIHSLHPHNSRIALSMHLQLRHGCDDAIFTIWGCNGIMMHLVHDSGIDTY